MNYLHRRNPPIVHRDLKSSNLLVDKTWTVKVCYKNVITSIIKNMYYTIKFVNQYLVPLSQGWRFWAVQVEKRNFLDHEIRKRNGELFF